MSSKRVSFRTIDGVTLRGDLYIAAATNLEHYIPRWGRAFVAAGFSVLIYDHRGWGSSERLPRNTVNPMQQAEDYHDAVLFAKSISDIDTSRIAIWGIGHSGGASMIAAGDDPYIKAVILLMPFFSGAYDSTNWPENIMSRVQVEREHLIGESSYEPEYIQPWDASADEAMGERNDILIHGDVPYRFSHGARQLSDAASTPWENKLTLQSLYHISKVEPQDHIHKIAPRPLLFLAATIDPISGPLELKKAAFERAGEPKQWAQLQSHHLANYEEPAFSANVELQVEFLKKYL